MLRFAPFLLGDMHISDMRIALINYILSRQKGEQFIVCIEDSGKIKTTEEENQETLDLLKKFAIEQDQLLYQSDNLGRYQQLALSLLEQKKAFVCICRPEKMETDHLQTDKKGEAYICSGECLQDQKLITKKIREKKLPYAVRIKKPDETILFTDRIKGEVDTRPDEIGSFMILGVDGSPTYDFATACDDILTDISMVIRIDDHISNIPRQIHIKHSLGYTAETEYAHIPPILGKANEKGDTDSIKWLLKQGFLPDAIINYLLLVGNKTPAELFVLPEAIEWFNLDDISNSPVIFDIDKLRLINRKHLIRMDDKELSRIFGFADDNIGKLLKVYLEEVSTINELEVKIKSIFSPKPLVDKYGDEIQMISDIIADAPMFDSFDRFEKYITEHSGLKGKKLSKPLRILMTGSKDGPELSRIYPLTRPYITEIARYTQ